MVRLPSSLFILSILSNGNALRGQRYLQEAPTTSPTTPSTSISGLEDDPGALDTLTASTAAPEAPVSWLGEESTTVATTTAGTDAPLDAAVDKVPVGESTAATATSVTGAPDATIDEEGDKVPADISSGGNPALSPTTVIDQDNATETVGSTKTTIANNAPADDEGSTKGDLDEAAIVPTESTMSTESNIDATAKGDSAFTGDAGEGVDVDSGSKNATDASLDSESTTSSTQNSETTSASETAGLAGDLIQSTDTTSATPGSTTPSDDAWFAPNDETDTADDTQEGWYEGDDSIGEEMYYEGDDKKTTEYDDDFEGEEWSQEKNDDPTYQPTPRPTHHAYESPSDDLVEESYTTAAEFDDDLKNAETKIEHAEEKVKTYLGGVESPEEMEQDKNVQFVAGVLTTLFIVLWLITAHQTMENPDGLCAR